eukprot:SAG11_NODE_1973_length_3979_cov_5.654897_3_plen_275_part_00
MAGLCSGIRDHKLFDGDVVHPVLCSDWEADFRRDGFLIFEGALLPATSRALSDEILQAEVSVEAFRHPDGPRRSSMRGAGAIDSCGPYADALLDAPLIQQLLGRVFVGGRYEVCHTTFSARPRGCAGGGLHQDFAFGPSPWCDPGTEKLYQSISIFVYPLGFKRGDCHLSVVPGSCHISAFDLLAGPSLKDTLSQPQLLDRLSTRYGLHPRKLELPPGSFLVCDNRTWHAVSDKPLDSPQPYRLFRNYVRMPLLGCNSAFVVRIWISIFCCAGV